MKVILNISTFFKEFLKIGKKNLSRREKSFYLTNLDTIVKLSLEQLSIPDTIDQVPIDYWNGFFNKINILDRNYRRKYKYAYSIYSVLKHNTTNKTKTYSYSSKKFIKSITSLISSGKDDILVDEVFEHDFSIKQLLKLFHVLNISFKTNDYRKDIVLDLVRNKLNTLIDKNAQKILNKNVAGSDYYLYPINKYKDKISYIYLKHEPSEINYKDAFIEIKVTNGRFFGDCSWFLAENADLERCSIYNSNVYSFINSKKNTVNIDLCNLLNTFGEYSGKKYLVGIIPVKADLRNCVTKITFGRKSKFKYFSKNNTNHCIKIDNIKHEDIVSNILFIYDPVRDIFLLSQDLPIRHILKKLNGYYCNKLISLISSSKLSTYEIFSRDSLQGNITEIKELMDKNK